MQRQDILEKLAAVLAQRKQAATEESYVATLYAGGAAAIGAKIIEEAAETAAAGETGVPDQVVHEITDLWFHTLVLLAFLDIPPGDVLAELQQRFGVSGHEEKASRG